MPTKDERLLIESREWGVFISCGCEDQTCHKQIVVAVPDLRRLGERLIAIAQQYEPPAGVVTPGEQREGE